MLIKTLDIKLDANQSFKQENPNKVVIGHPSAVFYVMENPNIQFSYDAQNHTLKLNYLKQFEKQNRFNALLKTWLNKLETLKKEQLYQYVVEIYYKHFPILITVNNSDPSNRKITVENFYGCKDSFTFSFTALKEDIVYNSESKVLYLKSHDDVTTGNQLENLVKIRYKTNLKNMDNRIFTDGFFIKKYIAE